MRRALAYGRRSVLLGATAILAVATGLRAQTPASGNGNSAPTSSAPAKPPDQSATANNAPQNLEQLAPDAAVAILGKKAQDASGHDMGLVVDVLVAADGLPRAAIIDFGGFLGVGSRKIAIDWILLQFKPDDAAAPVVLALDRAMVQAAPEYKPSAQQPVQIVGPPLVPDGSNPAGTK